MWPCLQLAGGRSAYYARGACLKHREASIAVSGVAWCNAFRTRLQFIGQVQQKPWMLLQPLQRHTVAGVRHKHLAEEVQALPREVKVAGKAVLNAHDPLHSARHR